MTWTSRWLLVSGLLLSIACGKDNNYQLVFSALRDVYDSPGSALKNPADFFCSKLDFADVTFAKDMTQQDQVAFAIGLNITGSFEGHDGWSSIANNFDDMGLSLGLLNENLGTSTLQPIMIRMRDQGRAEMEAVFAANRLKSLLQMLADWEAAGPTALGDLGRRILSILDVQDIVDSMGARETKSVTWAKDNLYQSNGSFKSEWKRELQTLAKIKRYIQLQVDAGYRYHKKALGYQRSFGFSELRSYLFFFDLTVQGGGFYPEDIADYRVYERATPQASDQQKLEKLLDLRLRKVLDRYKESFKARKLAVLAGEGTVQQTPRKFQKEYCYDGHSSY